MNSYIFLFNFKKSHIYIDVHALGYPIFNWRANFVAILALAVISFLGTLFFIEETLPKEKRRQFRLSIIISDYIKLLQSFEFIAYSTDKHFSFYMCSSLCR